MAESRRLSDPNVAREERTRERDAARRDLEDLKAVLSMPQGRRFVWRQLEKGGVFASVFSANGSQMCMNEGRRVMALDLFNTIIMNFPDLYQTMAREAAAEPAVVVNER